jgi:superfamily I DNA and/or RNA helicase
MVRLGHPARLLPSIVDYSLDVILNYSEAGRIVADIRKERDDLLEVIRKTRSRVDRKKMYLEAKLLKKEIIEREKRVLKDTLTSSQVILSTLNGAGTHLLKSIEFDYIIIDEVSQAKEAECWTAIPKGKRLIVAGDPFQLPPTIKCDGLARKQLEATLFHRLVDLYGTAIQYILTLQYRMNSLIMDWSSKEFYQGKLVAHPSVACHRLLDLPKVMDNEYTQSVLYFIDTAGCHCYETTQENEDESKCNKNEALLVKHHIQKLVQAGVVSSDIAVITPYHAQVRLEILFF